jgi:hypothetical protein
MNVSTKFVFFVFSFVSLSGCTGTATQTVNYPTIKPTPTVTAPPVAPVVAPPAPPVSVPPPAYVAPNDGASERALVAAISAYDRGDFGTAVRLLQPMTNDGSLDTSQQVRALKALAFSQCSTNAISACRQSFERAFRVDSGFDLASAERGHPIWGPQFERARKTVLGR